MSKTKTYEEYKLKSGKKMWHVHAYIGTDPRTGKAKYFDRRKFPTKAAAKAALIDAKADFQRGQNIGVKNTSPTLAEVYAEWKPLHDTQVRPSTSNGIDHIWLNHIGPRFGSWHIDCITPHDCQEWIMELAQKYVYLGNMKACLHMLFQYAIRMEYVTRNPTDAVEMPRKHAASTHIKKNFYELDELKAFINYVYSVTLNDKSSGQKDMRAATALLLIAATGMRIGEACTLRWEEIDLANGKAQINHTLTFNGKHLVVGPAKTQSSVREVNFGGLALDALRRWHKVQFQIAGVDFAPKMFVFASPLRPNVYTYETSIRNKLDQFIKAAGLRRITPHGLRHTKATLLNQAGVSPVDISKALGHTDSQFTMRTYVHATMSGVQAAERKFQALIDL